MKPDGACNVVNDTMQVRQEQKNNNDDEIQRGNATHHVKEHKLMLKLGSLKVDAFLSI